VATEAAAGVEKDIHELVQFIKKLGTAKDGVYTVTFGVLFKDEKLQDTLESLAGTLKAAKKRGIIKYERELLLQGSGDNEVITLIKG